MEGGHSVSNLANKPLPKGQKVAVGEIWKDRINDRVKILHISNGVALGLVLLDITPSRDDVHEYEINGAACSCNFRGDLIERLEAASFREQCAMHATGVAGS